MTVDNTNSDDSDDSEMTIGGQGQGHTLAVAEATLWTTVECSWQIHCIGLLKVIKATSPVFTKV